MLTNNLKFRAYNDLSEFEFLRLKWFSESEFLEFEFSRQKYHFLG